MSYLSYGELEKIGESVLHAAITAAVKEHGYVVSRMASDAAQNGQKLTGNPSNDEVADYLKNAWSGIPNLFTAFTTPSPSAAKSAADSLLQAGYNVGADPQVGDLIDGDFRPSAQTQVTHLADQVMANVNEGWSGLAKKNFTDFFGDLKETIEPQAELALVLYATLTAHTKMWSESHKIVKEIATKSITLINAVFSHPDKNGYILIDLVKVVKDAVGVIKGRGKDFGADKGLLKDGKQFYKDAATPENGFFASAVTNTFGNTVTITGGNVQAILNSMTDALSSVSKSILQQEDDLAGIHKRAWDRIGGRVAVSNPPINTFKQLQSADKKTLERDGTGFYVK